MQTRIISRPHPLISNLLYNFLWYSVIWKSEHPLVPTCLDNWLPTTLFSHNLAIFLFLSTDQTTEKLVEVQAERDNIQTQRESEVESLQLKIESMEKSYEMIFQDVFDALAVKMDAARQKWDTESHKIEKGALDILSEFGRELKPTSSTFKWNKISLCFIRFNIQPLVVFKCFYIYHLSTSLVRIFYPLTSECTYIFNLENLYLINQPIKIQHTVHPRSSQKRMMHYLPQNITSKFYDLLKADEQLNKGQDGKSLVPSSQRIPCIHASAFPNKHTHSLSQ